ncbi:protein ALP1-like [Centruroides sculpturatus]|uniref:protein ALP1-like n=1 Tax=Centruroides sculpturatus TaxID=218467 RepID=UPI000C6D83A5|nr:protein ALP1-like [Centruroides sculpturatus]
MKYLIIDFTILVRYLANGDYQISQAFAFRMGRSTVCTIIKKTCEAICSPNCDEKYRFIYVDIGGFGGRSDGGIFSHSSLGRSLETEKLDWPQSSPVSGMPCNLPYFMVDDEAFPLKTYLLRPYPGRQLTTKKRIFNYRLSRARRVIENTFGILSARWRILCRCIQASPETVDSIIKACVCLHNFVMTKESKINSDMKFYCPSHFIDKEAADGTIIEGQWRKEIGSESSSLPQRPCQQHNYIHQCQQSDQRIHRRRSVPAGSSSGSANSCSYKSSTI